jgi:hypothetical protein
MEPRIALAYDVLGVRPSAAREDVQRAFRQIVKRSHPDVDPSPGATERFDRAVQAYRTVTSAQAAPPVARSFDAQPEPLARFPGPDVARSRLELLAAAALSLIAIIGALQLIPLLV